ncbi:amidohydrolase [Rhodoferax aquaticus]|uniref:Amidohydrolase n=1 Tax=Rhodoferax aquaticus TaxID=2527691 RepID=A0A515EM06_9BURK|nr:amidohydrolase [Rhodoferax aquaticus]QDL53693.1 amidohydrolase [Rhodoferax aquaticus]
MYPHKQLRLRLLLCLVATLLSACTQGPEPDLIFHGGPVLTVNAKDEVVSALAVRDGVVQAVGSDAEIMALRGARTEVIDLQGKALMPGFVGAHEHPTLSAVFNGAVDLSGFTHPTNASVWQGFRDAVAKAPKGNWVYAGGLDPILTPDLRIPSRKELDALAPDNPVVLVSQTLHSFWANSKAFELAGIDRNTPDPGHGAYYQRDAQGELTGFVAETRAAVPLMKELKSPLRLYGRYVDVLDGLLAHGFTSVASLGYNVPPLMARVAASHQLQPRIRQFFYLVENELQYLPTAPDTSNPFFRVLGVKLWHDGSPYTGSMYSSVPYLDTPLGRTLGIAPGSHGEAMLTEPMLVEKLKRYTAQGWQVAIHSQGDQSNRDVLQAIAAAGPLGGQAPTVRMEHGVMLPLDGVQRMAALGVTPSFHIHHIRYYGDALAHSIIGLLAAQQTLPVRAAFEQGLQPTLHADSPMFPPKGFALMQTAMNRATSSGAKLNATQSIDVQQALRAMTIHGAYQLRLATETGSLEPGKWADLQVVTRNPYKEPVESLATIATEQVYVGGKLKYTAAPGP